MKRNFALLVLLIFGFVVNAQTYKNLSGFNGDIKIIDKYAINQPLLATNGVKKMTIKTTLSETPTYKQIEELGFIYNKSGFLESHYKGFTNFTKDEESKEWIEDKKNKGYLNYSYSFYPCKRRYQNVCKLEEQNQGIHFYTGEYDFLFNDKYNVKVNGFKTSLIDHIKSGPHVKFNYNFSGKIKSSTLYFDLGLRTKGLSSEFTSKKDSVRIPYDHQDFFLNPYNHLSLFVNSQGLSKYKACVNQNKENLFLTIGKNACKGNRRVKNNGSGLRCMMLSFLFISVIKHKI